MFSIRTTVLRTLVNRPLNRSFSNRPACLLPKIEDAPESVDPSGKQGGAGFIKSVLYGKDLDGAGNVLAPEDNTTHSKKLARGKYVHEMQTHRVKPEKVSEYIQL
ncbi:hypothetical protein CU098_001054, partial [Rhizopus stolonifer]